MIQILKKIRNFLNYILTVHFNMSQPTNNTGITRRRPIRTNNALTIQGKMFMENYARLISNNRSRAINKQLVLKYHKLARDIDLSIQPMTRSQMRQISLYYSSHAHQNDLILHALQTLINNGTINYEQDLIALRTSRTQL